MSDQSQNVVETKKTKKISFSDLRKLNFGRSRAYLFEYGLLLVLTITLINIVAMMFQELIGKQASFIQGGFYLPFFSPVFSSDITVGLFATFLVVFPAVVILIQRTADAERVDLNIKNLLLRKGLLNIFLVVASIWAIVSLVALISSILNYISLGSLAEIDFDWYEAGENLFKALLLLLAVWAFSSDYRNVKNLRTPWVMHIYRYTIVSVSLLAGILFVIFPFMDNRNQAVDKVISGDLYSIQNQINTKYYENGVLPADISELNLNQKEIKRFAEHSYAYDKVSSSTYQLCATFLADASQDYGVYPAKDIAVYPPYNNADFYNHSKGQKCFDLTVDNYYGVPQTSGSESIPLKTYKKTNVVPDSTTLEL